MRRTLAFTDLADSTALTEALGDARAAALWSAHDRAARELVYAHRGREVDKSDGFLLLFEAARDAADWALAYHRALGAFEPPLRARVGIHTGDVILTESPAQDVARGAKPLEVDGIAKPLGARVMALAEAGQTLLTSEALQALGEHGHRVVSHGHWRLKGVAEVTELFEVGGEGAPFVPPRDAPKAWRVTLQNGEWLPARAIPRQLPAERDPFVGRETELATLAQRFDEGARLVSVLGVGGAGKTRFALRYAWRWLGDFAGGAWFCDLSEARDEGGVVRAVAAALGVDLAGAAPVRRVADAIAGRGACLVVLDNFEQVATHAYATLGVWLDAAPEARFLVTTREVLGLAGEVASGLPPLQETEAVTLFEARAVAAAGRPLGAADAAAVRELVRQLDGLPLAIELAAARVRVMPPAAILDRLSDRFRLLTSTGGRRDRQATLKATLDWSWELLSVDERSALAQLSVFQGGFRLVDAEAVLALDDIWAVDAVQALVDKSLAYRVSPTRFDLLVSVQEYAARRLDELGGRSGAEQRHGAAFTMGRSNAGVFDAAFWRAFGDDQDNRLTALRRAVARGDGHTASLALREAWLGLEVVGPYALGASLAREVLASPDLSPRDVARATLVLGDALHHAGAWEDAGPPLEEAMRRWEALGDREQAAVALGRLASVAHARGRTDEALALFARARQVGDPLASDSSDNGRGLVLFGLGRLDEAHAAFQQALETSRAAGNRRNEAAYLVNMGLVPAARGDLAAARRWFEAGLSAHRETGNRRGETTALGNLGELEADLGRLDEAVAYLEECLRLCREMGHAQNVVHFGEVLRGVRARKAAEGGARPPDDSARPPS